MPTSILAISKARLPGTRGFTLIEIALVLVILAILLSFVAPRLLDLTLVRREASAERLVTILGYLHDEASLRGQTFRLTIDIDDSRYLVAKLTPDGRVVEDDRTGSTPLARDQSLPQGVRVASVETASSVARAGSIDLLFHPDADGAATRITLIDDAGGESVLTFDGVTGRARIVDATQDFVGAP